MEEYDAIVIGAGPAGLRASAKLASRGVNVLCLDKKQEIGVPVRCGEGLGLGWFKRLEMQADPAWAVQEIFGAAIVSPTGKKIEIRSPTPSGYILERRVFEKQLAYKAAKEGARIQAKTHVKKVERKDGKVEITARFIGEEVKYKAPIIVAADGVDSLISKQLGLQTVMKLVDFDSGFQYEMAGIDFEDPDLISLYFGNEVAPRGYVWIFPKGKHVANVGIGIGGYRKELARDYLDQWIAERDGLKNGSIVHVFCGGIPVGGFLPNMVKDNLIAVGDAAHQVDPIHGGGIGLAMEAADIVSGVVTEAVEKKDFSEQFLSRYNKLWYDKRGNQLLKRLKGRHFMEKLSDEEMEYLAGMLSGDEIMQVANGDLKSAAKLALKLAKRPDLVKKMITNLS